MSLLTQSLSKNIGLKFSWCVYMMLSGLDIAGFTLANANHIRVICEKNSLIGSHNLKNAKLSLYTSFSTYAKICESIFPNYIQAWTLLTKMTHAKRVLKYLEDIPSTTIIYDCKYFVNLKEIDVKPLDVTIIIYFAI